MRVPLTLLAGTTEVRIDLSDVTYLTIWGSSELVVPVAEGTLGGLAPTRTYPPRPFTPRRYSD